MNHHRSAPIVVLDSGLGGLTVVRALRKVLPGEDIVYFGDTARVPYGSKTATTVTGFVNEIVRFVEPMQPKHIVIACNTATALSLPAVRAEFPQMSISGVIDPGAKAAVIAAGAKQIPIFGVIATEATIRSKAYELAIHRRRHHARMLLCPTPLLVPIIEEGRGSKDPLVQLALKQYLSPLMKHQMDVLLLGCTHYPIFKGLIGEIVGSRVKVIDSAEQCADDVARRLKDNSLLRTEPRQDDSMKVPKGSLQCFVTDDPKRFAALAPRFLGCEVSPPTRVSAEELAGSRTEPIPISVSA